MATLNREWQVRQSLNPIDPSTLYGSSNHTYFTIRLFHGGRFCGSKDRAYAPQRETYIDYVNVNTFCKSTLEEIVASLGYHDPAFFYRVAPGEGLDYGLIFLDKWDQFDDFFNHVFPDHCNFCYRIYVETSRPTVTRSYPYSLTRATPEKIYKMIINWVDENPNCSLEDTRTFLLGHTGVLIPANVVRPGWNRARDEVAWFQEQGMFVL